MGTDGHRLHVAPVSEAGQSRINDAPVDFSSGRGGSHGLYYYVDAQGRLDCQATNRFSDRWCDWESILDAQPFVDSDGWEAMDLREIEYDYTPARRDRKALLLGRIRGVWFNARYLWDVAGQSGRITSLNKPAQGAKGKPPHPAYFQPERRGIGSCIAAIMPVDYS